MTTQERRLTIHERFENAMKRLEEMSPDDFRKFIQKSQLSDEQECVDDTKDENGQKDKTVSTGQNSSSRKTN
jgi:hypothetical protein